MAELPRTMCCAARGEESEGGTHEMKGEREEYKKERREIKKNAIRVGERLRKIR